jgi:MFS family permease
MASSGVPAEGGANVAFMLRAFKYRNYRLFFGGQIVSLCGSWMTITATSWLVYRLTGSALLLGVVGFASQVPAFLLMPFAGIAVDRWNRHRLLVATQTLSMLTSFTLATLTLSGRITIPALIAVSVVQGIVTAFDMPVRQAFVITLIEDKRDIGNAIALNSSMFNAARLAGPSIAGAIIAVSNEGWCYLIDGVSFLAVIMALLAMQLAPWKPHHAVRHTGPIEQLKEGWRYASGSVAIRSLIGLVGVVCLLGVPYTVLLPIYAGSILGGGPHTLGFLMTAAGSGALLGALWLATRRGPEGLDVVIPIAAMVFGAGLIGFALSRLLWLSLAFAVIAGFGAMVQFASSNTLLQTVVDDSKRGRVLSFFLMAYFGTTPFGSLVAGALSARYGAPLTLAAGGACCIAGAIGFRTGIASVREVLLTHTHLTAAEAAPVRFASSSTRPAASPPPS